MSSEKKYTLSDSIMYWNERTKFFSKLKYDSSSVCSPGMTIVHHLFWSETQLNILKKIFKSLSIRSLVTNSRRVRNKKVDVLFISKIADRLPLGIMVLSANLKKFGFTCDLIVSELEGKNLIKVIRDMKPLIIGYSVTTGFEDYYLSLNRKLKRNISFFSVMGGPHPTFFPEILREEGIDAICIGEGDYALVDLVKALKEGKNITNIPNINVKVNGKICVNGVRPLIQNLDDLPLPDRELDKKYSYYEDNIHWVMVGRGCPYDCTFCFNHALKKMYGTKKPYVRLRSVKNVLGELKEIKRNYPCKLIRFVDDTFLMNKLWSKEFLFLYKKEINIPFTCNVRGDLMYNSEDIVKKLKQAGCWIVYMGIETGNEKMRNCLLKKGVTNEQLIKSAKLFKKYHLMVFTCNMLGLPDETLESALETLKINILCRATYSTAYVFQPYPGTELGDYSIKKGYFNPNKEKVGSIFSGLKLNLKEKKKLERMQKLFAIYARFPVLLPILRFMISLPLSPLYNLVQKIYAFYIATFYFKTIPWKNNLKNTYLFFKYRT